MWQDKGFSQIKSLRGALSSRFPWCGDSSVLLGQKVQKWRLQYEKISKWAVILAEMDDGVFVKKVPKMLYNIHN